MKEQNFEISQNGVALGKLLFHDTNLSSNKKVSCATCHLKHLAFSDGKTTSVDGVSNQALERNSPALFNLGWQEEFFWDGGAKNIESQVFGPLTHADEMNGNLDSIVEYIRNNYPNEIKLAYGDEEFSTTHLAYVLAQFELSLVSNHSKYDYYIEGKTQLTALENDGLDLFEIHCSSCHSAPLFSNFEYRANGIDSIKNEYKIDDPNLGRYRISLDSLDILKYKTPSLRNIEVTAPYMHDGRFNTISEVIEHYSSSIHGIHDSALPKGGFLLTDQEKIALEAFLKTLTDHEFIQ